MCAICAFFCMCKNVFNEIHTIHETYIFKCAFSSISFHLVRCLLIFFTSIFVEFRYNLQNSNIKQKSAICGFISCILFMIYFHFGRRFYIFKILINVFYCWHIQMTLIWLVRHLVHVVQNPGARVANAIFQ